MKKYILTIGTAAIFIFYVIFTSRSSSTVPIAVEPTPATPSPTPSSSNTGNTGNAYADGVYTGARADAYYGYIQVKATISSGALSDIVFLEYPSDRDTSRRINAYATPILKSEAIKSQSANVDTVSGASDSSAAFRQSLANALTQATS